MGTLRAWWRKLAGNESAPEATTSKPVSPPKAKVKEGLQLVDDLPGKPSSRVGEVGFDPYSSDAGFAKPHTWERVDHD